MLDIFSRKKNSKLWSGLPINFRGAIVIVIPTVCLVATVGTWAWLRHSRLELTHQVNRQEKIILKSNQLLKILVDAETGVRGYNISREKRYLSPYYNVLTRIHPFLSDFEKLLRSSSQKTPQLQEIITLTQQQLTILKQWLALIENETNETTDRDRVSQVNKLLSQGKDVMDSLRASLDRLESQEQSLLQDYQIRLDSIEISIKSILAIATLISLIACMVAIYLFNKMVKELIVREQQLSKSNSLIEAMTTHIVDSIVTLNHRGEIETFNLAATKMFGYEPTEIKGEKISLLLTDPLIQEQVKQEKLEVLNPLLLCLEHPWQTTGYQKLGQPISIEISVSPIGVEGWLIAIIRDTSENEKAQAKLQARTEELTRLTQVLSTTNRSLKRQNQELDQYVYVASHDLKAPLRAIASLSEWIEEDLAGKLPEESSHQMQLLRGRVYRLQSLIDGLLAYSRIGRTEIILDTFNVEELLQDIIKALAPPPLFKIEINLAMPPLRAKKWLFKQVFFKLIDNAIKHHHCPVGHIHISVEEQSDFYQFAISDDGPGIAEEFHKKIFILFQTILARDVKENTGIGLAIAKKIVETEGGKIWLKSQDDAGTTFYFTWPKTPIS